MRDQRNQKCKDAPSPMSGVEMVGSGYFDEFLACGRFPRQFLCKVKSADQKGHGQAENRDGERGQHRPDIMAGFAGLRQPMIAQENQDRGDDNQRE